MKKGRGHVRVYRYYFDETKSLSIWRCRGKMVAETSSMGVEKCFLELDYLHHPSDYLVLHC